MSSIDVFMSSSTYRPLLAFLRDYQISLENSLKLLKERDSGDSLKQLSEYLSKGYHYSVIYNYTEYINIYSEEGRVNACRQSPLYILSLKNKSDSFPPTFD